MQASSVEPRPVVLRVLIGMIERRLQPRQLKRRDFVARGPFDRVEIARAGRKIFHVFPPLVDWPERSGGLGDQGSLDRAGMAAELRDMLAALVRHRDVVDAAAADPRDLARA